RKSPRESRGRPSDGALWPPPPRGATLRLMRSLLFGTALALSTVACGSGTHDTDGGIEAGMDAASDASTDAGGDAGACPMLVADPADSPVRFGTTRVTDALRAAGSTASVHVATADDASAAAAAMAAGVVVPAGAESYALFSSGGETWAVGRDGVG